MAGIKTELANVEEAMGNVFKATVQMQEQLLALESERVEPCPCLTGQCPCSDSRGVDPMQHSDAWQQPQHFKLNTAAGSPGKFNQAPPSMTSGQQQQQQQQQQQPTAWSAGVQSTGSATNPSHSCRPEAWQQTPGVGANFGQ